jgi:hypothetical protein
MINYSMRNSYEEIHQLAVSLNVVMKIGRAEKSELAKEYLTLLLLIVY